MADDEERSRLLAAVESHEAELRRRLVRSGADPLFDSGLTMRQLRTLLVLGAEGPLPQGELAHVLGVGLATMTGLVDRLVARGFVERFEDPHDRRVRRTGLSPQGAALLERIASAGQETRARLLSRIDLDALRGLERGLAALRAALEQDGC
ncbi:MAG: MarR family transcriptional regulator [Pseudonocardia sp.]|nr:MarR family transcriptional regulator [Pseudonocardia sp.]